MFEVELKFRLDDPAAVRRKIAELGAETESAQTHSDLYLSHPCRDFHATDEALRIRTSGEQSFLTYKGPAARTGVKTRREIEIPLGDERDRWLEVFHSLGFEPFLTVTKSRQPFRLNWRGREFQLALDEIPRLGQFLEVELLAEPDELAAAEKAVRQLVEVFGLDAAEEKTYLELVGEADNKSSGNIP